MQYTSRVTFIYHNYPVILKLENVHIFEKAYFQYE